MNGILVNDTVLSAISEDTPTPDASTTTFWITAAATISGLVASIATGGLATAAGLACACLGFAATAAETSTFSNPSSTSSYWVTLKESYTQLTTSISNYQTSVLSKYGSLKVLGTLIASNTLATDPSTLNSAILLSSTAYEIFLWQQVMQSQFAIFTVPHQGVPVGTYAENAVFHNPLYSNGTQWIGLSATATTKYMVGDVIIDLFTHIFGSPTATGTKLGDNLGAHLSDVFAGLNGWMLPVSTFNPIDSEDPILTGQAPAGHYRFPAIYTGTVWG